MSSARMWRMLGCAAKSEGPRSEEDEKKAADHRKREIADRKRGVANFRIHFCPH
jgi:hypothetical protein